jgi:hypothetical protein
LSNPRSKIRFFDAVFIAQAGINSKDLKKPSKIFLQQEMQGPNGTFLLQIELCLFFCLFKCTFQQNDGKQFGKNEIQFFG